MQELASQNNLPLAFFIYNLNVLDLRYFIDLLSDAFRFFPLVADILSDHWKLNISRGRGKFYIFFWFSTVLSTTAIAAGQAFKVTEYEAEASTNQTFFIPIIDSLAY